MEQVLKAVQAERDIRKNIETEFGITAMSGKEAGVTRALWQEAMPEVSHSFLDYYFADRAKNNIVFALKNDQIHSMLHLTPYVAAMRRNPSLSGVGHIPSMADVVRVDTHLISAAATSEEYRGRGYMRRLMSGALAYQRRKNIPFCFVETDNEALFKRFGFHYIYDRPQYELNTKMISKEMLRRAADGIKVDLMPPGTTLTAADNNSLLSLAHFVNANLCTRYGLFTIRNAVYYERFLSEIKSGGGNLFQIMENESLKGYFAYTGDNICSIREAVFQDESDIGQYFNVVKEKKPAVMARIVNLPEMLKHISGSGKVTIAIRLEDPLIAENDGLFIWYIDKNGSCMERVKESADIRDSSMRPEVTATIGEFAAFVFEYKKLKQNMKFDSIYLSGPAWINEKY